MLTKFHLNDEYFNCGDTDFIPEIGTIIHSDKPLLVEKIEYKMNRQGDSADIQQIIFLKEISGTM